MNKHVQAEGRVKGEPDIDKIAQQLLSGPQSGGARNICYHRTPMPSLSELERMMELLRGVLFPGYFSTSGLEERALCHQLSFQLDEIFRILTEQIQLGACLTCNEEIEDCPFSDEIACVMASCFMERLPEIRNLLDGDVLAAFEGDPAAKSTAETVFCYPSIHTMTNHRIAHALYQLKVPVIPRIIAEMAHSRTGIDIHPGASIGEEFFIDHGTGVVIGETCIIGRRCRLYQGVTLGALSFPKDAEGNITKGLPRHPILEDNVTVYSGATILGRITIGAGSMIGGNVWLTHDVPPGSKMIQQRSTSPTEKERMLGKTGDGE